MSGKKVHVVYLSPAGTTKTVGDVIAQKAGEMGLETAVHNLWQNSAPSFKAGPEDLVFVGSPVYAQHPLPGVVDFVKGLEASNAWAAVFTTYGMVTSGVALYDLAEALVDSGFGVLGGIKVPTEHSLLRGAEERLGAGNPNQQDLEKVGDFAKQTIEKFVSSAPAGLPLEAFEWQSDLVKQSAAEASLNNLKAMMPPMEVNLDECTQCGDCAENCPTGNISMDPDPVFGDACIMCFNCLNDCPVQAVKNPATPILGKEISKRKVYFKETEEVKVII